ncbi:MAG: hypothetical protein IPK10_01050 [Bacteroidetes bacterium]|nr:hypothetical protein [Bacteroidota bacterium]
MKTNNQLVICISLVMLFTTKNLIAQVSTPFNIGVVGDYVGWTLGENKDLNIVNEDRFRINFFTDAGPGSGGMWNNLRMFIHDDNGHVGIGNFATANTLLHLHQEDHDNTTVNFQMTNAAIGNANSDGFLVDVNGSGLLRLNQQERAPMQFWGMGRAV